MHGAVRSDGLELQAPLLIRGGRDITEPATAAYRLPDEDGCCPGAVKGGRSVLVVLPRRVDSDEEGQRDAEHQDHYAGCHQQLRDRHARVSRPRCLGHCCCHCMTLAIRQSPGPRDHRVRAAFLLSTPRRGAGHEGIEGRLVFVGCRNTIGVAVLPHEHVHRL